jgi:hypothetical protein
VGNEEQGLNEDLVLFTPLKIPHGVGGKEAGVLENQPLLLAKTAQDLIVPANVPSLKILDPETRRQEAVNESAVPRRGETPTPVGLAPVVQAILVDSLVDSSKNQRQILVGLTPGAVFLTIETTPDALGVISESPVLLIKHELGELTVALCDSRSQMPGSTGLVSVVRRDPVSILVGPKLV